MDRDRTLEFNPAPDTPASDERARKLGIAEVDCHRVIHDAGCSGRCHRPKARTAIRIEPRDHLIELAAESLRWNRDPDPNGKSAFSLANSLQRHHHRADHSED